jgi:hypothetical protein
MNEKVLENTGGFQEGVSVSQSVAGEEANRSGGEPLRKAAQSVFVRIDSQIASGSRNASFKLGSPISKESARSVGFCIESWKDDHGSARSTDLPLLEVQFRMLAKDLPKGLPCKKV